jgi:hypothetical protein
MKDDDNDDVSSTERELANIIRNFDKDIESETTVSPIIEDPDKVLAKYTDSVREKNNLPIDKIPENTQKQRTQAERASDETRRVNDEWIRIGFREAKSNYEIINSHIIQVKKTLVILHRTLIESMPKGGTTVSHRREHEILAKKLAAEKEAKEEWEKIFKELKHKTILAGLWALGAFVLGLLGLGAYSQIDKVVLNVINKNSNVTNNQTQQPTQTTTTTQQGKTK